MNLISPTDRDGTGLDFPNFSNVKFTPSALSCNFSISVLIDGNDALDGRSEVKPSAWSAWYISNCLLTKSHTAT
jgi:hypothetical protein